MMETDKTDGLEVEALLPLECAVRVPGDDAGARHDQRDCSKAVRRGDL